MPNENISESPKTICGPCKAGNHFQCSHDDTRGCQCSDEADGDSPNFYLSTALERLNVAFEELATEHRRFALLYANGLER